MISFFVQNLWYTQGVKKYGYVKGAGAYSEPRRNLTGDPWIPISQMVIGLYCGYQTNRWHFPMSNGLSGRIRHRE
jgi:hypothetical protein